MSTSYVFYTETDDGFIYGQNAVYATSRSTSATSATVATYMTIGQFLTGGVYYTYRGYLVFDTSTLPAGMNILSATLTMTCTLDNSATDFDVVVKQHDWLGNWAVNREADYDGALAAAQEVVWRNTSGMAINTQYSIAVLPERISRDGMTRYSVMSSRDVAGTAPGGAEYIQIGNVEHATADYRPFLTIVMAQHSYIIPASL